MKGSTPSQSPLCTEASTGDWLFLITLLAVLGIKLLACSVLLREYAKSSISALRKATYPAKNCESTIMDCKPSNESREDPKLTEAEVLIWALLDDEIETDDVRRLEEMLKSDPRIRQLYVNCVRMHTDLQEHFTCATGSSKDAKPATSPVLGFLGDAISGVSNTPPVVD